MMTWLVENLGPLMLLALVPVLASGVPVVLGLIGCGLLFGALGVLLGVIPVQLIGALPIRLEFIIANETLLAIPFFTLMGMLLARSGIAEDLLGTAGRVFGPVRGGLAIAAILVGTLLAAATGVVAASVISLALISFPAMQKVGYDARVASGVVASTGTLTQIVPPSLVLIVIAEQMNMSLGDVYAGVLIPAAILICLYVLWIVCLGVFKPGWVPAVPVSEIAPEERGGHLSLGALMAVGAVVGVALTNAYPHLIRASGRLTQPGADELAVVAVGFTLTAAFCVALVERVAGLDLLSPLARRVAFVLVPPLFLIFAVLGSVFLGAATPTESGALGAVAAMVLAFARGRIDLPNFKLALFDTVKLSCVVMILLFGATVFSLSFQALEGPAWVGRAVSDLPGGHVGFLAIVMAMVFVLGMFLDFFELAVIVLPIVAPVADQLGINPVWFAVLMGLNLQTSYLTPPFGFALFYLRRAIPDHDVVGANGEVSRHGVATSRIYWGAAPFIAIQVFVMALVVLNPNLVLSLLDRPVRMDAAETERTVDEMGRSAIRYGDQSRPPAAEMFRVPSGSR